MLLKETNIFTRLLDELSIPQAKQQQKIDGGDRSNHSQLSMLIQIQMWHKRRRKL
ncbi:hypothetical protein DPMN_048847 [Dreissena polymorpha]|uniref:Uncharacterized protein n=1 Tax=Dreissena polymorpha TaxID=45954 RepID=A0A9D4DBF7_DREPO|nr:hypothetical protein DPMN_048847 [Dreissena polymorpha]